MVFWPRRLAGFPLVIPSCGRRTRLHALRQRCGIPRKPALPLRSASQNMGLTGQWRRLRLYRNRRRMSLLSGERRTLRLRYRISFARFAGCGACSLGALLCQRRGVSWRRKTSRAVIARTIIDGSKVDMRESSGVSDGKLARRWTGKATSWA